MATGYTAPLYEGQDMTFEQFVLRCSRAFGALVTMRDDPMSAPIPTHFVPDGYYRRALTQSRADLKRLSAMTTDQARRAALTEWRRRKKIREEGILRANDVRYRYQQMLDRVRKWEPPTSDHEGLKQFMIEQLESSIDFDTRPQEPLGKPLSATAWKKQRRTKIEWYIKYYEENLEAEIARAASRTDYIQQLLTSLGIEFSDEPVPVTKKSTAKRSRPVAARQ